MQKEDVMRNSILVLAIVVLVGVTLVPLSVCAQPSMSEMTECYKKMIAFQKDLIDLGKYSQGPDKIAALGLIDVAREYSTKIDHLRDLLLILSLIKNDDNRNRVKVVVDDRMKHTAKGIDISLKEVNLNISLARSNAIVSTGNQIKAELRRLQELLSPVPGK